MASVERPPLSAAILWAGYNSAKYMFYHVPLWLCEDITACCYMYCYFRNIFPPWSSQMTIILITNAMYHIRYKNSEYGFKRKNPHGLITARHQQSPTENGKPPTIQEDKPYRIPKVEWHSPWCVSKNTWAVANTTVDIHIIQSICPTVTVLSKHKGTVAKAQ